MPDSIEGLKTLRNKITKEMPLEECIMWQQFIDQVIREIEVKDMMIEGMKDGR